MALLQRLSQRPLARCCVFPTVSPRFRGIHSRRESSGRDRLFRVSEEVREALATGKPVVALETTIYTHGYPYPDNVALSSRLESLVRVNGGVPATIGVLDGVAHVGMDPEQVIQLVSTAGSEKTWKISRRDLGFIGGLGLRGQKYNGGTTIAGTMILAQLAGIKIFATGGLGGVHRGGENSMDISADLTELGRTPVAVISSGCKSFLDIPRTLEYLETEGVGVGTFADGREGHVEFPAFFCRDSGVKSPQVLRDEADAAAIVYAQNQLDIQSGLLFANPVPEHSAMQKEEMDKIIATAVAESEENGISGSANTPYILQRIRELSNNESIKANTALIESNIIRGTKVAVELAKLELRGGAAPKGDQITVPIVQRTSTPQTTTGAATSPSFNEPTPTSSPASTAVDILVAGSLASDTICDYAPLTTAAAAPVLHTSNPAAISQSAGGVGHNVALAAHYAGASVSLASVVGDDLAGQTLCRHLTNVGLSANNILKLSEEEGARTAQYVAVNDEKKDLTIAMADMSILHHPRLESTEFWSDVLSRSRPKWTIVDANWSPAILGSIVTSAKAAGANIAFEPVSTAKAAGLFSKLNTAITPSSVLPNHLISLASPNNLELTAMYHAARENGLFESQAWWEAIDSFGLSSAGSRDKFVSVCGPALVDEGIPQQSIQLLPFIPNFVTKLGKKGCLLTAVLRQGDPRLTAPEAAPFVLSRNPSDDGPVGGVYMRLLPPSAIVAQEEIVSVNGIGDTMLGVTVAALVRGLSLEKALGFAQEAAVLTLKSKEAVSPEVKTIRGKLL